MGKLEEWLERMPYDRTYTVKTEQIEPIKNWMDTKLFQGGVSFNHDFTKIYRYEIPEPKKK